MMTKLTKAVRTRLKAGWDFLGPGDLVDVDWSDDGIDCLGYLRGATRDDAGTDASAQVQEVAQAYVFVHGFRGHHQPHPGVMRGGGTWSGFEEVIHDQQLAGDAYFIGYPSVLHDTHVNAAKLLAAVKRICDDVGASTKRSYTKLTFVAHSEGAVIVRKAMIRAWKSAKIAGEQIDPVAKLVVEADMVFFAPAQGGHRLGGPADTAIGVVEAGLSFIPGVGSGLAHTAKLLHPSNSSKAYQDLTAGSLGLERVQADTEAFFSQFSDAASAAKEPDPPDLNRPRHRTLWATDDRTVEAVDYATDQPSLFLRDASHTEVCKPEGEYKRDILKFVTGGKGFSNNVLGEL